MGSDGSAAGGGGKRPERVAAVGEGRRLTVAEDIRRAPQQDGCPYDKTRSAGILYEKSEYTEYTKI